MRVVAWGVGGERRVEVASEESVLAEEEFLGRPIRLEARWQGADLAIRLYGGSRAHIGSVVFAVVRPSLRDPDITSSTASVLNRPGHQDEWDGLPRNFHPASRQMWRFCAPSTMTGWIANRSKT